MLNVEEGGARTALPLLTPWCSGNRATNSYTAGGPPIAPPGRHASPLLRLIRFGEGIVMAVKLRAFSSTDTESAGL
jgi:hypothetical protein